MSTANGLQGRTADEWFAEALHWYVEGHQGCPCCQTQHCVFRSQWGARVEFYCTTCDFSAARDGLSKRCTAERGDGRASFFLLFDGELPVDARAALS
jgi:hypothetical protein